MQSTKKLWRWLAIICFFSFAALGWVGTEIYQAAPPIAKTVVSESGELLYTGDEIQYGQRAWLAAGGQQVGSVWGMGLTWRRTGLPTGCTGKPWPCGKSWRNTTTSSPLRRWG